MIVYYSHGGSGNHGCEALVRSTRKILKRFDQKGQESVLYTYKITDDVNYIPDGLFSQIIDLNPKTITLSYYAHAIAYKLGNRNAMTAFRHKEMFDRVNRGDICLCMGGDTYTYDGWAELLAYVNKRLRNKGAKTVLWGCSLAEELFNLPTFIEDLRHFDLITPRESITYEMLTRHGIKDNVIPVSDPAFELDIDPYNIHQLFNNQNDIIGLNISPLIISCESKANSTVNNYKAFIRHILETTDYNICFIPHVVWEGNDDRSAIRLLLNDFNSDRIAVLGDMDCCKIKGAISGCKFVVAARTHCTIAAYSQCIPTLVVGYSVKAKGIAKALFGSSDKYVLPVQSLNEENDLINAFCELQADEEIIKQQLHTIMPSYRKNCYAALQALESL